MKDQLAQIIRETFKLPPEMDIEDTGLGKVKGWTSLMHIKLILNIEKAFAIKIPSNKIQETQTFQSLSNLLSTLRAMG